MTLRVLVSGMACSDPWQGGATWAVMQYVLGLEHSDTTSGSSSRSERRSTGATCAKFCARSSSRTGRPSSSAITAYVGVPVRGATCQRFDAHLNVSGMLDGPDLVERIPVRVYVDLDPAFNQSGTSSTGSICGFDGHTHFVSVGQSVGTPDCPVPTCGVRGSRLCHQSISGPGRRSEAPGRLHHRRPLAVVWVDHGRGMHLGQRAHSMRPLFELPARVRPRLLPRSQSTPPRFPTLTRSSDTAGRSSTRSGQPARLLVTARFVQSSRAEISIAKSGYVASRCGWFSDRSACYLARVAQLCAPGHGTERRLADRSRASSLRELDGAVAAIEDIESDYAGHADRGTGTCDRAPRRAPRTPDHCSSGLGSRDRHGDDSRRVRSDASWRPRDRSESRSIRTPIGRATGSPNSSSYADGSSESLVLKDLGPVGDARRGVRTRSSSARSTVYPGSFQGLDSEPHAFRGAVVDPLPRPLLARCGASRCDGALADRLSRRRGAGRQLARRHALRLQHAESEHLVRWTPEYVGIVDCARESAFATTQPSRRCASRDRADRASPCPPGRLHPRRAVPSNVLVEVPTGRVCPVDWEMAGIGPLLLDLAALTSASWSPRERREIAAAYWRRTRTRRASTSSSRSSTSAGSRSPSSGSDGRGGGRLRWSTRMTGWPMFGCSSRRSACMSTRRSSSMPTTSAAATASTRASPWHTRAGS